MKQKIFTSLKAGWDAITKNPLGVAIVSVIAGAKATDLFSKDKKSKALEDAHTDSKRLTDRVTQLESNNGTLSILK